MLQMHYPHPLTQLESEILLLKQISGYNLDKGSTVFLSHVLFKVHRHLDQ